MKLCSHCRVYHLITSKSIQYTQLRNQTTIPAPLPLKKEIKHKSKRFTELLEGDTIINRRTIVKKMNPNQLSSFVNTTDISLDDLKKINGKKLLEFKLSDVKSNKFSSDVMQSSTILQPPNVGSYVVEQCDDVKKIDHVSVMEDLETSGISDSTSLIKSSSLLSSIPKEADHHEIEDEIETSNNTDCISNKVKHKSKNKLRENLIEMERLKMISNTARKESLIRTLNAYLQLCISNGMIGRAYHTIMHYRTGGRQKLAIVKDVNLYNILFQAYANRGELGRLREMMDYMDKDELKPTAKTYAIIFECYKYCKEEYRNINYLYKIVEDMKKQSITFDDILNESKTKIGQYSDVLSSIHCIEPGFVPTKNVRNESYSVHLLDKIKFDNAVCKSPAENLLTLDDLKHRFKIQTEHEINGRVEIKSVEKFEETKPIIAHYKRVLVDFEKNWKIAVSEAFDRDLKSLKNREYQPIPNSMVLYPCLCVLDKEQYVDAILREVRKLANGSETFSPSFITLCRKLGKYINDRYEMLVNTRNGYIKRTEQTYFAYADWYINRKDGMNSRIVWQRISDDKSRDFSLELQTIQWPINLQISVGKFLYGIILKDIKIDVNYIKPESNTKRFLPAFYTLFRSTGKKHLVEEIKPHPILSKLYRESQIETLDFDTTLVPSLCPPRPWTSINSGGYMLLKTDVVRLPLYAMQQWKRLENTPPSQMWPSLDSLNQLGSIPWTVNNPILDLAIKVFQDGGSVKLNVPQPPSVLPPIPLLQTNSSEIDRKSITKARLERKRKKGEMYSLWCDALYRLSLANHFRDKVFWLPHNMDFRGRVYPVPPHLNHLGSDLARSMLIFALGKPLGPNGLDWLKIHTINLTGFKKRDSISERLKYANEILDKILDSAENPMTGEMWWATSDEPWQTLACCMEIATALKSPNPEEYICRFPIHQDGSCNGLQHYAALGRDQIGALSVNLYPTDTPQDVYSKVAIMVDETRQKDAAEDNAVAKALEGFVTRKVIKQTVMTTVYGVTKFGARLQIARQLKDLDHFPQEYVWSASLYLTQKTFDSLRTMFESAKQIQDWFTDCARVISTLKGQNIEWVTPLGLPVIQPYSKVIPVTNSFKDVFIDSLEKPNAVKQKNAFAPNFVHSLDSCHMMLTSLHCEHAGLTFVSVHDCYWTHPSTVELMNKICREQFVALHSEPILENLSQYFIQRYLTEKSNDDAESDLENNLSERKIRSTVSHVPKKGNFDLKSVLKSTYFFS
ncbi:hypothetical protein PV327_003703 [Microctonus hyperodae]|uniref:DNA-directed RNA polymerase n=1 Tax=Microctonus hyperodae TaxID=165561 RepID=A0AA39G5F4_MICHY|nr:hypothetical protein PV327_003703 [Microctonus hyperodae]